MNLCNVWIRSSPCLFGTSVFDTLIAASTNTLEIRNGGHCDVTRVDLSEHSKGGVVSLLPSHAVQEDCDGLDAGFHTNIPLGRSKDCPTMCSEVQEATLAAQHKSASYVNKSFVSLAVVGMVHDCTTDKILITRRPSYMRSFPRAYVFPGGGVHDGESLVEAVSREVYEETGLLVDDWKLESLWESVYPTVARPGVPIKAHHLVCYFSGRLNKGADKEKTTLDLCKEEVDGAVWLSPENTEAILEFDDIVGSDGGGMAGGSKTEKCSQTVSLITKTENESLPVPLRDLMGIYPRGNCDGSEGLHGIAQGSLFALQEFLR